MQDMQSDDSRPDYLKQKHWGRRWRPWRRGWAISRSDQQEKRNRLSNDGIRIASDLQMRRRYHTLIELLQSHPHLFEGGGNLEKPAHPT